LAIEIALAVDEEHGRLEGARPDRRFVYPGGLGPFVHRHIHILDALLQAELLELDASVPRHHDADIVAQSAHGLRQRARDVGQPARLGERHALGSQVEDLQRTGIIHDERRHLKRRYGQKPPPC
jgi:hypothetical protein